VKNTADLSAMTINIKPGNILVARPTVEDGFFTESVLLVIERDSKGTIALCINKKHYDSFQDVMRDNGETWNYADDLYVGGLTNNTSIFLLHTHEWYSKNTVPVNGLVSVSSDAVMTEKINNGNIPNNYKFIAGVTSWGPKQLESEIAYYKNWLVMDYSDKLIWSIPSEDVWQVAVEDYAKQAAGTMFETKNIVDK
jgi:putative transcriptional regulator